MKVKCIIQGIILIVLKTASGVKLLHKVCIEHSNQKSIGNRVSPNTHYPFSSWTKHKYKNLGLLQIRGLHLISQRYKPKGELHPKLKAFKLTTFYASNSGWKELEYAATMWDCILALTDKHP